MLLGGHVKIPEDIEFLTKNGFDFGELVLTKAYSKDLWSASEILSPFDSGFFLVAHGPREGPPNDIRNIQENYFPALKESIRLLERLGITFLTIHMWVDSRYVESSVRTAKAKVLGDVVKCGQDHGVTVALENLSETAEDLDFVCSQVPELVLTLDLGHGQLITTENTSFRIIEKLGSRIRHLHVHDNHGGKGVSDDLHLPPGEGIIDIEGILQKLRSIGYDNTLTLELENEQLVDAALQIRSILKKLDSVID